MKIFGPKTSFSDVNDENRRVFFKCNNPTLTFYEYFRFYQISASTTSEVLILVL